MSNLGKIPQNGGKMEKFGEVWVMGFNKWSMCRGESGLCAEGRVVCVQRGEWSVCRGESGLCAEERVVCVQRGEWSV